MDYLRSGRFWLLAGFGSLILACCGWMIYPLLTQPLIQHKHALSITTSPQGSIVAVLDSTGISTYNLTDYEPVSRIKVDLPYPHALAWTNDMTRLVTTDAEGTTVHVWDVATSTRIHTLPSDVPESMPSEPLSVNFGPEAVVSLEWHPDGILIAIGRRNGRREIWNLNTNTVTVLPFVAQGGNHCFGWNPTGTRLMISNIDSRYELWSYEWPSLTKQGTVKQPYLP